MRRSDMSGIGVEAEVVFGSGSGIWRTLKPSKSKFAGIEQTTTVAPGKPPDRVHAGTWFESNYNQNKNL